jgi:RHS repeat-associated protein
MIMKRTVQIYTLVENDEVRAFSIWAVSPAPKKDQLIRILLLMSCMVLFPLTILGQGQTDQTNPHFTQGAVSDSAQMSLSVPLTNYPGRGLDLPISLNYSANVWNIEHLGTVQFTPPDQSCCMKTSVAEAIYSKNAAAGWKSSLSLPVIEFPSWGTSYDNNGKPMSHPSAGCFNYRIREVYIHMPDGSTHTLRKSDQPYASQSDAGTVDMSGNFYAIDGSRIRFDATGSDTGTIYMPDGTRYLLGHPESKIIDRNGNFLTYNETSHLWTDTIGRAIANPLPLNPVVDDVQYIVPGLSNSDHPELTYVFKWRRLQDVLSLTNGKAPDLKVMASEVLPYPNNPPASGNFPEAQPLGYDSLFQSIEPYDDNELPNYKTFLVGRGQPSGQLFNPVVLAEIVLPDETSYKFSYNLYAQIDKVTYPTGTYEKYVHTGYGPVPSYIQPPDTDQQPYLQAMRWISSRKVSESGEGDDEIEWTYVNAPNPDGGGNTEIINPDGTKVAIERIGPGAKYNEPGTMKFYYRFGDKDPRVGMTSAKTFYSKLNGGVRSMLRRELFAYDAHDSYSTEYNTACSVGTKYFGMRRAARLARQTNIIFEGSGSALAQSAVFSYDTTYEMSTGMDETYAALHDFVVLSNSTAQTAAIGSISLGNRLNYTETVYNGNSTYRDNNILGVMTAVTVKNNSGTVISRSEMAYDDCPNYCWLAGSALPTKQRMWDSSKGAYDNPDAYVITKAKFDAYGNKIESIDAKGHVTATEYDPTHHAFPVKVTLPVPDPGHTHGSNSAFTTLIAYDPPSGLVLSSTDVNNQLTTMEYNDPLLRLTKVTANEHQTLIEYGDGTTEATRWIKTRKQFDDTRWSEGRSFYDGLGRTYKSEDISPQGSTFTQTEYDEMGRVKRSAEPYKAGETIRWTTPTYDNLSRTEKVTSADSNEVNIVFGLSTSGVIGTTKTITDQATKKRKGITDALGNMVRVIEDPDSQNLVTDYVFDLLGNLRKTTQADTQGQQVRYFSYNSLGRLIRAKQVEQTVNSSLALPVADPITGNNSWTVKYEYDDNANITSMTDAKGVSTTATYDQLDRLTFRDYSDSTPDVDFYYDGKGLAAVPEFSRGKTTMVKNSVSENRYTSFNSQGKLLTSQQLTTSEQRSIPPTQDPYTFNYSYNLSGALTEETYPSGRVVKNTFDEEGEISQVKSKKNSAAGYWTYADAIERNSAGAITKLQLGNGHWENATYNERQQVVQMGLGRLDTTHDLLNLEFKYKTGTNSDNNGSMREQKITVPAVGSNGGFTAIQTYTYDSLNRLQSAAETISSQTWKQTFLYDRYANRRFDTTGSNTTTLGGCAQMACNPTIDKATNRFASGQYYTYDANGNIAEDPAASEFTYDGENRQTMVKDDEDTIMGEYSYDGEGNRIIKKTSTETTIFVYDANGRLAAEYSTLLAVTPQVSYLTSDHLGSARVITNENGAVVNRKDFAAFGDETITSQRTSALGYTSASARNVRQDYTGYEKDTESGLDYAQARYYNSQHGRFTSVDPLVASADIRNPQSFNRYSYALNSPYKFTDPLGLIASWDAGLGCQAQYKHCDGGIGNAEDRMLMAAGEVATRPPSGNSTRTGTAASTGNGTQPGARPTSGPSAPGGTPRNIIFTGVGTADEQKAVTDAVTSLKMGSKLARNGFARYETPDDKPGPTLTIEIMSDTDFKAWIAMDSADTPNAAAATTNNGGGDQVDSTVPYNAIIYIKQSSIDVGKENADRAARTETALEAIIGHELKHALGTSFDHDASEQRRTEDKANKVTYFERRNEISANTFSGAVYLNRVASGQVSGYQKKYKFPVK